MSDETIPAVEVQLRSNWDEFRSFRESVRALMGLTPLRLRELYPRTIGQLEGAPTQDELPATNMGAWLATAASVFEPTDVLDGVSSLLTEEDPDLQSKLAVLRDDLEQLMSLSPDDRWALAASRAEYVILPNLESISGVVDLRVVRASEEDGLTAAPVVVLRLNFDEPIGGSSAIAFQVAPSAMRNLSEVIDSVQEELDVVTRSGGAGRIAILAHGGSS